MRLLRQSAFGCYLLLAAHCPSQGQMVQARHSRVELLSDHAGPTQRVWLGVHFSLEKDWHIYWVNPGDSGQPPVLKWQLPAGFRTGEIRWPRPEKLRRASLADYGYEGEVVLLVPLQVANSVRGNGETEIGLDAKWLICRDVCMPDHVQLHLALAVSPQEPRTQRQAEFFLQARERLPKPWPRLWKSSAISLRDDFVVSIDAGKPIKMAEIFPLEPEQIENAATQPLETTRRGAKITLKKSDQLLKPILVLKGVLVLNDGESYEIQAPVTPVPAQPHANLQRREDETRISLNAPYWPGCAAGGFGGPGCQGRRPSPGLHGHGQ